MALVVVFLLAISACSGQPNGTVKGTVKYKGTIVPTGQVIFYGEGDQSAIGPIMPGRWHSWQCFWRMRETWRLKVTAPASFG